MNPNDAYRAKAINMANGTDPASFTMPASLLGHPSSHVSTVMNRAIKGLGRISVKKGIIQDDDPNFGTNIPEDMACYTGHPSYTFTFHPGEGAKKGMSTKASVNSALRRVAKFNPDVTDLPASPVEAALAVIKQYRDFVQEAIDSGE